MRTIIKALGFICFFSILTTAELKANDEEEVLEACCFSVCNFISCSFFNLCNWNCCSDDIENVPNSIQKQTNPGSYVSYQVMPSPILDVWTPSPDVRVQISSSRPQRPFAERPRPVFFTFSAEHIALSREGRL